MGGGGGGSAAVAEGITAETQKSILDAFEIFDHDHNKTVDAREIGTIIRFLGHCPSEQELQVSLPKNVAIFYFETQCEKQKQK